MTAQRRAARRLEAAGSLAGCPALQHAGLGFNRLAALELPAAALPALVSLDLTHNALCALGPLLAALAAGLPALRVLGLAGNPLALRADYRRCPRSRAGRCRLPACRPCRSAEVCAARQSTQQSTSAVTIVPAMQWQCPAQGLLQTPRGAAVQTPLGAAVRVCMLWHRESAPRSAVLAGLPALHFLDGADLRQPPAAPPPPSPPAPAPATAKRRAAGGKAAAVATADAPGATPRDLRQGARARAPGRALRCCWAGGAGLGSGGVGCVALVRCAIARGP